ncbi:MAG: prepilin-type N-terminal cleavage/methylation domain-containing protein [Actinomycetota bacterium]|nr:prepilin-type N-terminal cleavage/methylation domain-containing protein [Actinomycetota bacterium]
MLKKIREMQDEDGFTLIELMVVVLIIAILIAIALPTFLGLRERAQNRAAQSDLRNGLAAAKAFYTDNETFTNFGGSAAAIEPSLSWNVGAGSTTQVGIRIQSGDDLVLTRQSESDDWFCALETAGVSTVRGPAAAEPATVAACTAAPVI